MMKKNYIIFLFWFFRILLLTVTVDIHYSRLPKSEKTHHTGTRLSLFGICLIQSCTLSIQQ